MYQTTCKRLLYPVMVFCVALAAATSPNSAPGVEPNSLMESDPDIVTPELVNKIFSPKLKPLWLKAMAQPEVDLKRQAADTIAEARQRGMTDLEDTAEDLTRELEAVDQHPVVKLSAARTLILLDARQAAPVLFKHAADGGQDMRELVEPGLAAWDYKPMRAVWLARLKEPGTPQVQLLLAIRGVDTVKETEACADLRKRALDPEAPADIRVAVAGVLGRLQRQGLQDDARPLAADTAVEKIVDRLVAALMIRHHDGDATEKLLLELAVDPQPAVAAVALQRLLEIDPMLLAPISPRVIVSPDSKVRWLCARILVGQQIPEAVALLGTLLDDPHPGVRGYAAQSMVDLAAIEKLDKPVRQAAMKMVMTDRPRGLEQASLVLGALDHEPAADRLVELLEFKKRAELLEINEREVHIYAAWALRCLAVPATAGPIFDKIKYETDRTLAITQALDKQYAENPELPFVVPPLRDIYDQVNHLIQALGMIRYPQADPLLRRFLPKPRRRSELEPPAVDTTSQPRLRGAAVWALGHLYADQPKEDVTALLRERLVDTEPSNPEVSQVRCMSAVSLGRMKDSGSLEMLKRSGDSSPAGSKLGNACAWGTATIKGQPAPKIEPIVTDANQMDWFVEPLEY